ncbi:MAG: hypothetical protein P0Y66_14090 [Candidatus Kaistia colombiensis]|nr:MAG: hypothetical protein P0Y66_14090 [Kaistia sp.]
MLWTSMMQRMGGVQMPPVVVPDPRDRRFKDPQWTENQFFDFVKQFYLITRAGPRRWSRRPTTSIRISASRPASMSPDRQCGLAVEFLFTNPELLRDTLDSSADNLVRGMDMLAEDIAAGNGELIIRQSDNAHFAIGKNLALSPGQGDPAERLSAS